MIYLASIGLLLVLVAWGSLLTLLYERWDDERRRRSAGASYAVERREATAGHE